MCQRRWYLKRSTSTRTAFSRTALALPRSCVHLFLRLVFINIRCHNVPMSFPIGAYSISTIHRVLLTRQTGVKPFVSIFQARAAKTEWERCRGTSVLSVRSIVRRTHSCKGDEQPESLVRSAAAPECMLPFDDSSSCSQPSHLQQDDSLRTPLLRLREMVPRKPSTQSLAMQSSP